MALDEKYFAFLDTETTGLLPGKDEVLEIATILTDLKMNEIDRIEMKVQINQKVQPEVAKINGYNEETWKKEAKPFDEWKKWLTSHVKRGQVAIPVGHNIGYDRRMIDEGYYKKTGEFCPLGYHMIDTVAVAALLRTSGFLDIPNLKLTTVSAALKLQHDDQHRAMGDVKASMGIFRVVLDMLKFIKSIEDKVK